MSQRKLRGIRAEYELTAKAMAKLLNISPQSYSSKEKGRVDFTMSEMFKISALFQKPMDEIFLRNEFGDSEL